MDTRVKRKAGVVAYRRDEAGQVEVLVITSREYPESWIFPVGTVERGETLAEASARECAEESGYRVTVGKRLARLDLAKKRSVHRCTFFTATVMGETGHYETGRQRKWVPLETLTATIAVVFEPVARAAVACLEGNSDTLALLGDSL